MMFSVNTPNGHEVGIALSLRDALLLILLVSQPGDAFNVFFYEEDNVRCVATIL